MSDIIDDANDTRDFLLATALAGFRNDEPIHHETCLNCDEPTVNGHAFCDDACKEDFEVRERVKRKTYALG